MSDYYWFHFNLCFHTYVWWVTWRVIIFFIILLQARIEELEEELEAERNARSKVSMKI